MFRGGDEFGCSVWIAIVFVMILALGIGLVKALFEAPWLWAFVIAAGIVYMLARREERRGRCDNFQPPSKPDKKI